MNEPNSELFAAIVGTRNVELTTKWTRFNIHLLVNGGLLVTLATANQETPLREMRWWPYLFGLILALLWWCSEFFGWQALKHRDLKIEEFEKEFWSGTDFKAYKFFRCQPKLHGQFFVSTLLILLFTCAWLFLWLRYARLL